MPRAVSLALAVGQRRRDISHLLDHTMHSELIAVFGTLLGVLIGGLINYLANRSVKNHEWRLALAKDQVAARQKLYAGFLVEAQRLAVQASERKVSTVAELDLMGEKFAEISLVAPDSILEVARRRADCAVVSHSAQLTTEAADFFQLKIAFIAAARQDIAKVLNKA